MQETPRCRLGSFGKTPSPPRPEFKSRPAARCGARSQLSPRLKQLLLVTNTHCRSYLSRNQGQGRSGCCRSRCSCRRRSRATCSLPRRYACLPSRFPKLAPGAPRSRLRRARDRSPSAHATHRLQRRTELQLPSTCTISCCSRRCRPACPCKCPGLSHQGATHSPLLFPSPPLTLFAVGLPASCSIAPARRTSAAAWEITATWHVCNGDLGMVPPPSAAVPPPAFVGPNPCPASNSCALLRAAAAAAASAPSRAIRRAAERPPPASSPRPPPSAASKS